MRKVKPWLTVVPVVLGAVGAVTVKPADPSNHISAERSRLILRLSGLW